MKIYLTIILGLIIVIAGCSSGVTKDTTNETIRQIAKTAEDGIQETAQNISDASPYLKEDMRNLKNSITEGFWQALDAIEILVEGESVEDIPKPSEVLAMQKIQWAMHRGIVRSADKIRSDNIEEHQQALETLSKVVQAEMSRTVEPDTVDATGVATPATDIYSPGNTQFSAEKLTEAWETLSKIATRPETARNLFMHVEKYIDEHPELKAHAGIAGPVLKEKIGEKATEFLSKLKPGEVSETVKFKDGYLTVQLIEDTGNKVEVGYVYIPEDKEQQ